MSPGARSGVTAALVFLALAASSPALAKAPPVPPGPPSPVSKQVAITPVPRVPGRYVLRQTRAGTLFTETGMALRLVPPDSPAQALGWGVAGARAVRPQPLEQHEARFHYLVGPPEDWQRNLPTWGALYYPEVAPGVDLWFEARKDGVEYSLRAQRGADLRQVRLEWRGAQALKLADNGRALEVTLPGGTLREEGLLCGQERADGTSIDVACRYREVSPKGPGLWEYVIEVDVKDPKRPAWVDPIINWNTFIGDVINDELLGIAVLNDGSGKGAAVGWTENDDILPQGTETGPATTFGDLGGKDVLVTRFNNDGTLAWTTIFGGTQDDVGEVIVLGTDDTLYIAGTTASSNFLVPNNGSMFMGQKDGFVARMSSGGSGLEWVRYLGNTGIEEIHSMVLGPMGKLYVAGSTTSSQLAGSDAGVGKGGKDLFVSRLNYLTGAVEKTLVSSGGNDEEASNIVTTSVNDGGVLFVTGYSKSADFPRAPVQNGTPGGGEDVVVLRLDQELVPVWGTFLGGLQQDRGYGLVYVPGPPPRVMVVGSTNSNGFLTSDGTAPVGTDAFLARLNGDTGAREFSTVVGGLGEDEGFAIAPGFFGSFFIGGRTTSDSLPALTGPDRTRQNQEGFVIRMGTEGSGWVPEWSTFVGGGLSDEVRALSSGRDFDLYIAGVTTSSDMLLPWSRRGGKLNTAGSSEIFIIGMEGKDLTPPKGEVKDGFTTDQDTTPTTTTLQANWDLEDRETGILQYEVGVGSFPGCTDIKGFQPAGLNKSFDLPVPNLTPGQWYFVTVRATNTVNESTKVSSDGIFVLLPNGGPTPIPPAPGPVALCPGEVPDGGVPDAGTPDAGAPDGGDGGTDQPDAGEGPSDGGSKPQSPVGYGCGTTGASTGLAVLMLLAIGLWSARRKA